MQSILASKRRTKTVARQSRPEPVYGKSWLSVRHIDQFVRDKARLLHGVGIDYGCGNMPYAEIIRPHVDRLLGVDLEQSSEGLVDVILGKTGKLPFGDGSLDFVLCTQVLEHVPDPESLFMELTRCMKAGGIMLLTVPFVWEQHEVPEDYFRFTEFAVRRLAKDAGLVVVSIDPAGGMIETVAQIVVNRLPSFQWFDRILYGPINVLAAALDKILNFDGITCNWHAVLRKPLD